MPPPTGSIRMRPFSPYPLLVTRSEPSESVRRLRGSVPTATWRPAGRIRHPEGSTVVPSGCGPGITRVMPGPQPDGTTVLPSGWRIRPAGRQVAVGTLPRNLLTLSDGSLLVTNNGYGENGLMRIDPVGGGITWRYPLKAAWLGLARSGRDWRDTVWASGAGTNRVYRLGSR